MDYKERIRALREDNDYTQSRIAGLLNIGQISIYSTIPSGFTLLQNGNAPNQYSN